ncbi:MAG: glycosyltransferase [Candidatus Omnitrophica bacterium]|nr:glycosyltransferase [Candidatus Omnitrophota bacterium]
MPRATIIMRSKNSDWVIDQALAALYSQDYKDFKLLVVDSGSTDRTLEIVKKYPHELIEIEAKAYYPGLVLNMAIERCDTELIIFQNSDSVPLTPDCLGNLVAAFDHSEVQAAFGRQLPRPDADAWVVRDYAMSFPDAAETPEWIKFSLPLAGFRKSIWEKHHFYTDAWASEDTEWGHWARSHGYQVKYVANACTMHSHNYTYKQLYGRRFVEGEADAFINDTLITIPQMLYNIMAAILRDMKQYLAAGDLGGLWSIPVRRAVYHWAHYKGNQLGWHRKHTGDTDASAGQGVVLKNQ